MINLISFIKKTILSIPSKISGSVTVEEFFGRKTLFVKGVSQSGGEYEYMWKKVFGSFKDKSIKRTLMLGVGGGTAIKYLLRNHPFMKITGIEIDPVMRSIAKKYFLTGLPGNVKIIIYDAFKWISEYNQNELFDLVIVDLYMGRFNPEKTRSITFLRRLKKLLKPSGFVIYNSHFLPDKPDEYIFFLKQCSRVFVETEEIFKYPYNRILYMK